MNHQEHEYMHAHGIEHTHQGETDPHHSHEHIHEACEQHNCNHDCGSCGSGSLDPKAEAIALMQYMVKHNTAHASELAKLGQRMYDLGENVAGDQIMQAVSDFEKGNLRLSTVLAALNIPKA